VNRKSLLRLDATPSHSVAIDRGRVLGTSQRLIDAAGLSAAWMCWHGRQSAPVQLNSGTKGLAEVHGNVAFLFVERKEMSEAHMVTENGQPASLDDQLCSAERRHSAYRPCVASSFETGVEENADIADTTAGIPRPHSTRRRQRAQQKGRRPTD